MSTLYIVATPIGHLDDISLRAIAILQRVDLIAAEDTRHSGRLLQHYHIQTAALSYHEHNEREVTSRLIHELKQGKSIALLSDAGTPLISDPGYHLVKAAHDAQITVVPVPGACAAIAALSVAGLASDRFIFEGFLPAKMQARQARLYQLAEETRTLIFYEAPHRIQAMLQDLQCIFGDKREATLARELTKTFETVHKSTLGGLVHWIESHPAQTKGEFVVVISGIDDAQLKARQQEKAKHLLEQLLPTLPLKKAVQLAADIFSASKNTLYTWALKKQK